MNRKENSRNRSLMITESCDRTVQKQHSEVQYARHNQMFCFHSHSSSV